VDYEANLRIKINCDGKWIVHSFIKDHNHEVFPTYAQYFPCHRRINVIANVLIIKDELVLIIKDELVFGNNVIAIK